MQELWAQQVWVGIENLKFMNKKLGAEAPFFDLHDDFILTHRLKMGCKMPQEFGLFYNFIAAYIMPVGQ